MREEREGSGVVTKVVNEKCMSVHLQFVRRTIFSAVRSYSRYAQEYMYQ